MHALAAQLREYLGHERRAGEDGGLGALAEEEGLARGFADDEAAVVEGGRVFCEPGGDLGFPGRGEEVGE